MRILLLLTFLFVQACAGQELRPVTAGTSVTFIHLNDTYRIDALEEGKAGGFARVATIIRDLQDRGREVHILHAGDFLFPSLESRYFDGKQMVEAMNYLRALAPLYVVPGNHEFDSADRQVFVERVTESKFEWLSNNIVFRTGEDEIDGRLRTNFTFPAGGSTIGIFALTLRPDEIGSMPGYAEFTGHDYTAIAESAIRSLQAEGADLIIGLTHLKLDQDEAIAGLGARYPEFRLIAGGHEHNVQHAAGTGGEALIVKGDSNARRIWQIDVEFRDSGPVLAEKLIEVDDAIPEDEGYTHIPAAWGEELLVKIPFLESRIGEAAGRLDGRESTLRTRDSGWGMFIADQMANAFPGEDIDMAFVNSGSLRIDDFIEADIAWEDIARTFAYSSHLRYVELHGEDFRELLEAGYRGNEGEGYFPQIAGFRVCVDRDRENGKRIVQLQVPVDGNWTEIDGNRIYSVVAPDFIVRGGDGYDFSKALHTSPAGPELKYLVLDGVMRATAKGEKVAPAPTGPRYVKPRAGQHTCFTQ